MPSRINHIFKGMMRFPCAFKIKNSVKTPLQTVKSYKKGMVIKEFQSRQDFNHCIRKEQPPRVIAQSPTKPPKHSLKTIKFWSSTSEVWPNSTKVNEFCSINPVPEDLTFPFRHNCSSFLLCTTDDIIKISSNHATTSHVISCVCESRSQKISDAFGLA